jgi:hypothetical protein
MRDMLLVVNPEAVRRDDRRKLVRRLTQLALVAVLALAWAVSHHAGHPVDPAADPAPGGLY